MRISTATASQQTRDSESASNAHLASLGNSVLYAQIRSVQSYVPSMVGATVLAALAVVCVFGPYMEDPLGPRLWLGAMLSISVLRYVALRAWRHDDHALTNSRSWNRLLLLLAAVTGALWSLLATVLLPEPSSGLQPLMAVMLMGVSAAVVVSHVTLYWAYALFLVSMLVPAIVGFALLSGLPNRLTALMLGIFLLLLLIGGRRSAESKERTIRLEFDLRDLAAAEATSRAAAEQSNAAKDTFLSNMSHELRTPLHSVLSYAQIGLAKRGDPEKVTTCLERIRQSGRNLNDLLGDLFDLTTIESGSMVFARDQCDLGAMLRAACSEFSEQCAARSIRVELTVPDQPVLGHVDADRFGKVIRHVLDNALTFSPEDSVIAVELTHAETIPNGPGIRIAVEDRGPGIPAEERDAVFDKFYQSTRTRTGAGGTGLGLAICKGIVAAHGGSIYALGNTWGGTTVEIILPRYGSRSKTQVFERP